MTQKAIDILEAANKGKTAEVRLEIPSTDGKTTVAAILTPPDVYSIQRTQDIIYKKQFCEYRKEGLDQELVDEDDWQAELDSYKDSEVRKRIAEDKPRNMAQQGAKRFSKIATIQELIPKYLKDLKGNLLFTTKEERDRFRDLLCSDIGLMNLLAEKYVELVTMTAEVADQVKNSSEPVNSTSGESEKRPVAGLVFSPGPKK